MSTFIGVDDRNRTCIHGFAIHCVTIPPRPQIGIDAGSRTPAYSFGDCRATVTLHRQILVDPAGLEPTLDPL